MSNWGYLKKLKHSGLLYPFTEKNECVINYETYYLDKLCHIFKWENLPETIPEVALEIILLTSGHATITQVPDKGLYAFFSGLGGRPDGYYRPTESIIANPGLEFNKVCTIDEDCIVIRNDSLMMGIMPLIDKYITQMVENDITQNLANINMRMMSLLTADDDDGKAQADRFIGDLINGKLSSIHDSEFSEKGIRVQPYGASGQGNQVTQLIEYAQWLKGSVLQEFGIKDIQTNIKREYVNDSEINDFNIPNMLLINDMLYQRQKACERINDMYGTNITVSLSPTFEDSFSANPLQSDDDTLTIDDVLEQDVIDVSDSDTETEPVQETETETDPETEPESAVEELTDAIEELADAIEEMNDDDLEQSLQEQDQIPEDD